MEWLLTLVQGHGVASTVLVLGVVVATGLALGSVQIKGISLGIAGVLFSGLAIGHFSGFFSISHNTEVIEFCREFGLILFVYSVGMQVGPGFLASLRKQGLPLNIMAAGIVLLGAAITLGIHFLGHVPVPAVVGLFSGATTNTPCLAAAGQAIRDVLAGTPSLTAEAKKDFEVMPGLGYAVAYPFGVLGIILAMLAMRLIFRVNVAKEEEALKKSAMDLAPALARMNIKVTNPNLEGKAIYEIPMLGTSAGSPEGGVHTAATSGIVISRILKGGALNVPTPETQVQIGDVLLAVGTQSELEQLRLIIGQESEKDLRSIPSSITTKSMIVTRKDALGKTLAELDFVRRYGVQISRINRMDIEFTASANYVMQYGDQLQAVGDPVAIKKVAAEVGDSPKALNHPQMIPIFVGIALGVILGSWPVSLPGFPAPVKLGLAGGPLLMAIILSRIGRIGPMVWYLPISANFMLRELGITLFLACVGIKSGDRFLDTLVHGDGMYWMMLAAMITIVPLLIVGLCARLIMKVNYLSICGLLAGSMTDPPALAFANTVSGSDAPSIAYATVYPLTMILRVIIGQVIVLLFFHAMG